MIHPRFVFAAGGGFVALLGIVFFVLRPSLFALMVVGAGVAITLSSLWPEAGPIVRPLVGRLGRGAWQSATGTVSGMRKRSQDRAEKRRAAAEAAEWAAASATAPQPGGGAAPPGEQLHRWPPCGDYGVAVVGESNYQSALALVAGRGATGYDGVRCVAMLVPEASNPHDPQAVAIRVEGRTVGYLAADDAVRFRLRLGQFAMPNKPTECGALIRGGGKALDGSKRPYGIWLDIQPLGETASR